MKGTSEQSEHDGSQALGNDDFDGFRQVRQSFRAAVCAVLLLISGFDPWCARHLACLIIGEFFLSLALSAAEAQGTPLGHGCGSRSFFRSQLEMVWTSMDHPGIAQIPNPNDILMISLRYISLISLDIYPCFCGQTLRRCSSSTAAQRAARSRVAWWKPWTQRHSIRPRFALIWPGTPGTDGASPGATGGCAANPMGS